MIPAILCSLMAAPMGYCVGKAFVRLRAEREVDDADRDTVMADLQFIPIASAVMLPLASILAILVMMEE